MNVPIKERFRDRVAVVTGAASGIGEAIAHRLAAEGANVVLFDTNERALGQVAEACGGSFKVVDIGDEHVVETALNAVVWEHDRLDIMVNSAGVVGATSTPILDYSAAEFERVLRVNLLGSFYMIKYALKPMLEQRYGRILLLASIAGKEGNPGMAGYSVSKAGVIGLIKAAGKEVASMGVTVNGIAPAVVQTPMNVDTTPEQLRYMTERIPMGRLGTTDEVAALACWIVSEEASFNTGFVFDLSGGRATY